MAAQDNLDILIIGGAGVVARKLARALADKGTLRGKDISAADYIELLARRQQWIARVQAQMADHDLMLMPTVPVVAPKIAELEASDEAYFAANGLMLRNPTLINFLDGCAVSLPCHRAGEAPDRRGGPEEPGVPRDTTERPPVLVVHLPLQ